MAATISHKRDKSTLINITSGAFAGCLTAIVTCPLDVLKTRLQSQSKVKTPEHLQYRQHVLTGLRRIIVEEGFRGLYKGLTPTIIGYLPTWIIYFTCYDHFKRFLKSYIGIPPLIHMSAAVMAGTCSTIATNPLWLIKTRLMTQDVTLKYNYRSTFDAIRTIYKTDGLRGYYKGLSPSLLGVLHVAVQFPLYEFFKSLSIAHSSDQILAASVLSKLVASVVTYPHEVIRTKMHNESIPPVKYKTLVQTFQTIVREESWRGLYTGIRANLMRTLPAAGVTLVSFEYMHSLLEKKFNNE